MQWRAASEEPYLTLIAINVAKVDLLCSGPMLNETQSAGLKIKLKKQEEKKES